MCGLDITSSSTAESSLADLPEALVRKQAKEVKRSDYQPSVYKVLETDLDIQLDYENTNITTTLRLCRDPLTTVLPDLILHGDSTLKLQQVQLLRENHNEEQQSQYLKCGTDYKVQPHELSLCVAGHLLPENPEECFKIIMVLSINPSTNTDLSGLYKSGPMLCTQMEAEGFRRLTYSLDRPDVMSTYRVRLEASKSTFPVLLSNGNIEASGDLPGGRHFKLFVDPFPKPSYLVAIVAGDLSVQEDVFTRSTGVPVKLSLWCEPKDSDKLGWAMTCLKQAMKWDEDRFGLVYDLNWLHLVAVSYFNMGAMENKGLLVFNTACLLAHRNVSTDEEVLRILDVVGHEYFHNWTGNRVTCRDWFQLTLKEGLTVYRDQEFSYDLGSRAVERIKHVLVVRGMQFPEDASPMSHPIRPESYQNIDNFYTHTVYRKGAEVIRMYETILGREGFRKGMDLYFKRHDGTAVTCDDFRQAMMDANGVDLTQFELWYSQAGTPVVTVESTEYNAAEKSLTLVLSQRCDPTPKQPTKKPLHIPVAVGLLGRHSRREILPTKILHLTEERQSFVLPDVVENPVLSLFRNFSAPVKFVYPAMEDLDYGLMMEADTDGFNRWEAGQKLLGQRVLERATKYRDCPKNVVAVKSTPALKIVVDGFRSMLAEAMSNDPTADLYFIAFSLVVPDVSTLMPDFIPCDPVAIHKARCDIKKFLVTELQTEFSSLYERLTIATSNCPWDMRPESLGRRALRNCALSYLTLASRNTERAYTHYTAADNMTDRLSALAVLVDYYPSEHSKMAIADFLDKAQGDDLIIDKWFSVQAGADHEGALEQVMSLKQHALFNLANPNRTRSLLTRFTMNAAHFHRADGLGYAFLSETIVELDKVNGRVAANLTKNLIAWQNMDSSRQELMKAQVSKLASQPLSDHCNEIVTTGLLHTE